VHFLFLKMVSPNDFNFLTDNQGNGHDIILGITYSKFSVHIYSRLLGEIEEN
jgi:hypothetical protein